MTEQANTPDKKTADDDNQASEQSSEHKHIHERAAEKQSESSDQIQDTQLAEPEAETDKQNETPNAAETYQAPQAEPVSPQPQLKQKSNAPAWFALLIALSGLGLAGWLYWLELQKGQQAEQLASQLQTQQTELEQSVQANQNRQADNLKRQLAQALESYQSQVKNELTQQQQAVQNTIDELSASFNKSQTQAVLVDVRHLIQLASRKLYIEQDKAGAIAILKLAQSELSGTQNSQWFNLNNQISTDIAKIQALAEVDIQRIYLKLTELNQQLSSLPLNQAYIPKDIQSEPERKTTSTISWQNVELIWQEFLELFLPKRREGSVEPLLTPTQELNLRQNLSSKLNQIQWAVLNNQALIYQSALSQTQTWVKQYFQLEHALTSQVLNELSQLQQETLSADFSSVELGSAELVNSIIRRSSQNGQVDL